jgi:hypothetical protein
MPKLVRTIPETVHDIPYPAHPQDSLAVAEHIPWRAFDEQLEKAIRVHDEAEVTANSHARRAWLCREFALATTDESSKHSLLRLADIEARHIAEDTSKSPRNKVSVNAKLHNAYSHIFGLRALHQDIEPVHADMLQHKVGSILMGFLDYERPLRPTDYGMLSELVVTYGLLNQGVIPFLTSEREEGNNLSTDNHDFYVLTACNTNVVRKIPISVKHNSMPQMEQYGAGILPPILHLRVGRLAMQVAEQIPSYQCDMYEARQQKDFRSATRLLADIMVCHANSEILSEDDTTLLVQSGELFSEKVTTFSRKSKPYDYPKHAEVINHYTNNVIARPKSNRFLRRPSA